MLCSEEYLFAFWFVFYVVVTVISYFNNLIYCLSPLQKSCFEILQMCISCLFCCCCCIFDRVKVRKSEPNNCDKNITAKIYTFDLALLLHMKLMLRGLNITIECKSEFFIT